MSQLKGLKLSAPKYNEILPSTGERITIRPFTVGDEKVLLIASNTGQDLEIISAIKQIVDNCSSCNVEDLCYFDIEYLFIKIRAISVGETSNIVIGCQNCAAENPVTIDLSKIKVTFNEENSKHIKISDELLFEMDYPKVENIFDYDASTYEGVIKLLANCVKTVYYGEEAITVTYNEYEDLVEIIENLTQKQFESLVNFLSTLPKIRETVEFTCTECSHENKIKIEGMNSFF
jgi:hypothetical protein